MNKLLENNIIVEANTSSNIAYILKDATVFSVTGYKVLKRQENGFVRCEKSLHNGEIKFIYFTNQLSTLDKALSTADQKTSLSIIMRLISTIIEIMNNGFLACQNIDLSPDKIFLNENTLEIKLIYFPVSMTYKDINSFESEFRLFLRTTVVEALQLSANKKKQICSMLDSKALTIKELYNEIYNMLLNTNEENPKENTELLNTDEDEKNTRSVLEIRAERDRSIVFSIEKEEFVIGKSVSADGVIESNKAISRRHCKIVNHDNSYFLVDLKSSNGTFLNDNRLMSEEEYMLKDGDIIRLANDDFKVCIQEV